MSKQARKLRRIISIFLAAIMAVSCFSVSAAAAEKTNADVGSQAADTDDSAGTQESACGGLTRFTNNQGWENVYAYAWNADGIALLGDWPGMPMNQIGLNDFGEPIFGCTIPSDACGFLFNSGYDGDQTGDIEIADVDYYVTGERDQNGHLIAYPWNYTPTPKYFYGDVDLDENITIADATKISFYLAQFEDSKLSDLQQALADVDGSGAVTIADATAIQFWLAELEDNSKTSQRYYRYEEDDYGYSFKLFDNLNWGTIYVYAWDEDGFPVSDEWPGTEMEYIGESVNGEAMYGAIISGEAKGMIFLSGESGEYSVELTPCDEIFYSTGEKDENGALKFYTGERSRDFDTYFVNSQGWENVYVYAWDDDGNALMGDWPGTEMIYCGQNDDGEKVYGACAPDGAAGLVFAEGENGDQTEDAVPGKKYYRPYENRNSTYGHLFLNAWDGDLNDPYPYRSIIYFTDSQCWENVYVYAWDDNDNELLGDWPGTKMMYCFDNDFDEQVYGVNLPLETAGIVFNSGVDGDRTVEIVPDSDSYYASVYRDIDGRLKVSPSRHIWRYNISLADNQGWNHVYIYAKDSDGNELCGKWPGKAMNYRGLDERERPIFGAYIPFEAKSIVFNTGVNGERSVELKPNVRTFYFTGNRDENGFLRFRNDSYNYDWTWNSNIYFINSLGWKNVYVYAWDDDGNALMGDWPGTEMMYSGQNDYGEEVFMIRVPENCTNIIFSNGNGLQTVDIYTGDIDFDRTAIGYYITDWQDGMATVDTWNVENIY